MAITFDTATPTIKGVDVERMTSLQIAELTGKDHAHVMRDIRNMEPVWEKIRQSKFGLSSYKQPLPNGGFKDVPCYNLTKTECLYIATKYNDEARAKLILRWEQLELERQVQTPKSFAQALYLAAQQQEQIEKQQKMLEVQSTQINELTNTVAEMSEKISYIDRILQSKETVTVTQIAQDYGMSAKAFNKILAALRIQRKVNGQWILYSDYIAKGYVHSKATDITRADGSSKVVYNTEWTQKGRLFLYETLKQNGNLPLIEQ